MPETTRSGQHMLRVRALCGDDFESRGTFRGELLKRARHVRALRSWVKEGCYAWWRMTGELKAIQQEMLKELRA